MKRSYLLFSNELLAKDADTSAKTDDNRSTPLHYAALKDHKEIAKGANVNPKNNFGQTLLDFATNPDNPNDTAEIVDLLRKHGGKTGEELKTERK